MKKFRRLTTPDPGFVALLVWGSQLRGQVGSIAIGASKIMSRICDRSLEGALLGFYGWETSSKYYSRCWFQITILIFCFYPEPWGDDPIWRAYFWKGLVQPPPSMYIDSCLRCIRRFLGKHIFGTWWDIYPFFLRDMIQTKNGHLQYNCL